MPDREKVIKAWEIFRDSNPYEICSGREFRAIREPEYCMGQMIEDTIELLKEQSPQLVYDKQEVGGVLSAFCPSCGRGLYDKNLATKYCYNCGQAVKWNDD